MAFGYRLIISLPRSKFLILLAIVFTVVSCNQGLNYNVLPQKANHNQDIIPVELKRTEIYEYRTGISGDEEGASIKKQGQHHEISEIIRDSTTNWEAIYRYQAKKDYVGKDEVEIETSRGSDGTSLPTEIEVITIRFIITN